MISVLILTRDEEANLPGCLESLRWADEVVVLDSFSRDRTVEVARDLGARVLQRRFDDFASQRNFGLEEGGLRGEWVLHLDADERVPPALRDEILARTAHAEAVAYRVASKTMFRDRWLRRAAAYPVYQLRLGRRDALRFEQVGHGQRGVVREGKVGTLREPLLHYTFSKGLGDWIERHNRYSAAEAERALRLLEEGSLDWRGLLARDPARRRRALKDLSLRLPARPLLRFLYQWLWRGGFLDGREGLDYALLLGLYELMTALKLRELRRRREPPA